MKSLDMEREGDVYRHAYSEESFWDKEHYADVRKYKTESLHV
jgi:hypothetical protein